MTADDYTQPERSTEVRICRRIQSRVLANPCAFCRNRTEGFGLVACRSFGRTWWECRNSPIEPTFSLDESTIK